MTTDASTLPEHGLGWIPDPPDPKDHKLEAFHPELMASPLKALRRKVDMRNWIDFVNQQQTNSCVGHGIWGLLMHAIKRLGFDPYDASPFFIYWVARMMMGGNWTQVDQGAYIRSGMQGLANLGASSRRLYESYKPLMKPSEQAFLEALEHQAVKYTSVPMEIMQWKTVLDADLPIVYGFNVYSNHTGVYNTGNWPERSGSFAGGHCEFACGYDDDRGRPEQVCSQGSWGPVFGPEGWFNWKSWNFVMAEGSDAWILEIVEGATIEPVPTPEPTPTPQPDITQFTDEEFEADYVRRYGRWASMDIALTHEKGRIWRGHFDA